MRDELLQRLGVTIDPRLLELALTHTSYAFENRVESNERLEFLGDAILGFIVSTSVFKTNPELAEGDLTRLKNSIISAEALATAASRIELGKYLNLGKGEDASGGRQRLNILADAMEAVIASSFLSGGLKAAESIVDRLILPLLIDPFALRESSDPKTTLSEKLSRLKRSSPVYRISFSGPEHERLYLAKCFSDESLLGEGEGRTIKSAETSAALRALGKLGNT
jgi:ribonuclease-3